MGPLLGDAAADNERGEAAPPLLPPPLPRGCFAGVFLFAFPLDIFFAGDFFFFNFILANGLLLMVVPSSRYLPCRAVPTV